MSIVAIVKTTENDIRNSVAEIFNLCGGTGSFIKKDDRVLLKPNFIAPRKSSTGATTDLRVIEAVIQEVMECGGKPVIAEGVPLSFDADQTFRRLGVDRLAKKYGTDLVNLDKYPASRVVVEDPLLFDEILVSNLAFEVDKIINLPIMKTHTQTTVTLGMKNLKGFIPGKEKLLFHNLGLDRGIVDLNSIIKPAFTLIDAIVAMEGKGPTGGIPKPMDLLLGSADILALEVAAVRVMGFNPSSIRHIQLARNRKIGVHEVKKITVRGCSIDEVAEEFLFPRFRINGLMGRFFLGCFLPWLAKLGIDITALTQKFQERLMPYPIFEDHCTACARCIENCPRQALTLDGEPAAPVLDRKKCIKCYVCDEVCVYGNVKVKDRE
jgi:uncharacterized protein (DUF362 family)/NAD-dependent dihydropyrimidine dehydrogenase PreA subunit